MSDGDARSQHQHGVRALAVQPRWLGGGGYGRAASCYSQGGAAGGRGRLLV